MGRGVRVAIGLAVIAALTVAGNAVLRLTGAGMPRETPQARAAMLAPHYDLRLPEGAGPFPAVALFSGCDGVRDNMGRWAEMAVAQGWAALIVDSHAPRGLGTLEVWRLICAGQLLAGPERAGDVAVALAHLREHAKVDDDRLAVLGASHGGWAVLDMLALAAVGRPPDGLTAWPEGGPEAALAGLRGALLLYPYCGAASQAARRSWAPEVELTMLLVAGDAVVGDKPCRKLARALRATGAAVETVTFEGVTHGFDQRDRSAISTLRYDAAATRRALALGRDWLAGLAP